MDSTWSRLSRVYGRPGSTTIRLSMRTALVFALLVLILATHARFLLPLFHGLSLAGDLVDAQAQEADFAAQNAKLLEVLAYLETPAGQQLAARADVFALSPGERQIVLLSEGEEGQPGAFPWSYRFQESLEAIGKVVIKTIRHSVEAMATWVGVSERDRETWHEITEGQDDRLVPVPVELWPSTGLEAKSLE